jgi:hypothetical protein
VPSGQVSTKPRAPQLVHSGPFGDSSNYSLRVMAVEALTVGSSENRSMTSLTDGEIDARAVRGARGMVTDLAALAQHRQGAMSPLETKPFDVRARGFRHPESIEREQRDQSVFDRRPQAATSKAPSSLRSSRPRGSRSPGEAAGRGPLGRRR